MRGDKTLVRTAEWPYAKAVPTKSIEVRVVLNGTNKNPWHRLGLTRNPFPQIGRAEYDGPDRQISELGGAQFQTAEQLRAWLIERKAEPDFIALCVRLFEPGKIVHFTISFPEGT